MSALLRRIGKDVDAGKTANPTNKGGALLSRIDKSFSVETLTNADLIAFQRDFEKDYMADWGDTNIKHYAGIRDKVINAMRRDTTMSYQQAWDMAYNLLSK